MIGARPNGNNLWTGVDISGMQVTMGHIPGMKECLAEFKNLAPKMQVKIFRRGIRPALILIQKDARARVRSMPIQEGDITASEKKQETGQSLRDLIASSITVKVGVKPKIGIFGNTAVRYQRRGGENVLQDKGRAALAHLLEFGFNLQTAYYGTRRIASKEIEGHHFMQLAFESQRTKGLQLIASAFKAIVSNPEIGRKELAQKIEEEIR